MLKFPLKFLWQKKLSEQNKLENVLTEQATHKVTIASSVRANRRKWLELANANAKQTALQQLTHKINMTERFEALRSILDFPDLPERIECFDISHMMGEETVGSCVVFNREGALKSDYRRFNITNITPGDDIAAMKQVLKRRYQKVQKDHGKMPEIVLIDGGIAQLHAAESVFKELTIENVFLIGVAKGVTRKPGFETLHFSDEPSIQLAADSLALHLIQQIRDEAHRFAITGHRNRRDRKRHTSLLEKVPGIGAKRRRELLRYFGGIQALNRASLEEIEKVPGISRELARRIFEIVRG
jgi:excinuclease ABC subunit C